VKVAHISEVFWPQIGGIETAMTTLFRYLPDIQHVVFTNPWDGSALAEQMASNVVVNRIPPSDTMLMGFLRLLSLGNSSPRSIRGLTLLTHLLRETRRRRRIGNESPAFEIIHLHSAEKARYFFALDAKYSLTIGRRLVDWWLRADVYQGPILITDHSLFGASRRQFNQTHAGEVLRRIRYAICVERSGYENAEAFVSEHGLDVQLWHVPNPVDTDLFPYQPMPDTPMLRVGYVGRAKREGVDRIFEIAAHAPDGCEFHLALAGGPSDLDRFQPHPKNVRIEWNIPNGELPKFYSGIHFLLDPWSFGAPRTALEALSTGRVVIRLRSTKSFAEEVPETVSPVVRPRSSELFSVLQGLREDPSELERMGKASRALAVERFEARRIADAYRRIYHEILQHSQLRGKGE